MSLEMMAVISIESEHARLQTGCSFRWKGLADTGTQFRGASVMILTVQVDASNALESSIEMSILDM